MKRRTSKDHLTFFAPAIVLTIAGFLVAYQFVDPAPPKQITIATGQASGVYYAMASQFSRILARDGVTVRVKETSGSVENLALITDEKSGVDVIFLQGGVGSTMPSSSAALVSLGSLYYEPLWLFHRAETPVRYLSDLRGKRIAAGISGSGTKALAMQLLSLNDVTVDNSRILQIPSKEASRQLLAGEIDAAFFVVAYRSNTQPELLTAPDVELMSFRRGRAYARRLHYLSVLTLPQGAVDFSANIPSQDISLLAPTAQLVAREDFHPALIDLLLQASREVGSPAGMFENPGDFPAPEFLDFPLSPDAKRFYENGPPFLQRFLPFWLANLLIRMKIMLLPLVVLLFPLVKMLPPFYRWRVRSRIFRWYDRLMTIDAEILGGDGRIRKDEFLARLDTIEKRVSQIRVPLGFSRELYDMRVHIEMLREKLVAKGSDVCAEPEGDGAP